MKGRGILWITWLVSMIMFNGIGYCRLNGLLFDILSWISLIVVILSTIGLWLEALDK